MITLCRPLRVSHQQRILPKFGKRRELWWSSLVSVACGHRAVFAAARFALAFSAAWIAAATLRSGVAFCRHFDTPDYLIPYYLRDTATRFRHYATFRRRKGGPKYMTVEDFVRALLASRGNEPLEPSALEGITQIFRELDADGNMYLSLTEFSFLMVLLTAKMDDIRALFSMLDRDRVGSLSLDEFAAVLRGLGCSASEAKAFTREQKNGIVKRLFGDDGQRRCSYNEIAETINALNEEVWKTEFRQVDTERCGRITAEQFGRLIANQVIGSHVPFHMVDNIRKLRGSGNTITLDLWIGFHRVMQHADAITEAVELFGSSGLPLLKRDFNRAVKAAGLLPFPEVELDIIMALFDRNGDGVLEFDELVSVMRQKLNYHYSSRVDPREKKSLPVRFVECVGEVLRQ